MLFCTHPELAVHTSLANIYILCIGVRERGSELCEGKMKVIVGKWMVGLDGLGGLSQP